jgi:hypothetical protein
MKLADDPLLERCRALTIQSSHLRARTRAMLARIRARHALRATWLELILRAQASPELLVASCVRCARIRTPDGVWRTPAPPLRAALGLRRQLTHTYCEDCVRECGGD